MRFIQFLLNGQRQFGAVLENNQKILNLTRIANNTVEFLTLANDNPKLYEEIKERVKNLNNANGTNLDDVINKSDVEKILAPITNPDKVICIGMNYKDHCKEINVEMPKEPIIFNKFPSSIVGPYDPILYPKYELTKELDWEAELTVVIGKKGKHIDESEAFDYVAGYTIGMDVSARDVQLQKNAKQWFLGKSMDTFCPLGPVLVTSDEIPDPHNLNVRLDLNGIIKQNGNTEQLIFRIHELIAYCSKYFTLLPGDLILTGTPSGVGCFRKPPEYLKVGDVVESKIEFIGSIVNKIVQEE